ncbi:hypothetical protein [Planktotalea sp.]|uniref:hypothetical protein n=1 Tax=Planktotalea sp. TaxID=2029877 RepID=UPI0025E3F8E2|nr:hypothetical protein [Planktotalea sp.]
MNRIFLSLAGLLMCLAASHVHAGAWPHGKGKTFSASSATFTWPDQRKLKFPDIYGSTYLEHGITPRLTKGLDMATPDAKRHNRLRSVAFSRFTLTANDALFQVAVDGGGGHYRDTDVMRFGLSYRIGFKTLKKDSWISVDAHTLQAVADDCAAYALDATYGITLKHGKIMGQISTFQAFDDAQSISVTPAYAHRIGKSTHFEVGVVLGIRSKPDPTLKIGI